jgi:hypothetical protein
MFELPVSIRRRYKTKSRHDVSRPYGKTGSVLKIVESAAYAGATGYYGLH